MAKADVLDRVAADLADGRTQPAIQRLGSLVATHPTDLDLRQRLASVHRMIGNLIEAGRWNYLDAGADPEEIRAFERAFPSPAVRLRKLRWPARDAYAATEFARRRLVDLADAAGTVGARPATGAQAIVAFLRHRYAAVAAVAALPFAVLGAVTVAQWIVG